MRAKVLPYAHSDTRLDSGSVGCVPFLTNSDTLVDRHAETDRRCPPTMRRQLAGLMQVPKSRLAIYERPSYLV